MSKIEWTNRTWNPVTGCNKISAGCKNCYAETMHKRLQGMQKKYAQDFNAGVVCHESELTKPGEWTKPSMVFVNSMSDLFHDDVPFEFIARVFVSMAKHHQHTYQVLTKRADRLLEFFEWLSSTDSGIHHVFTWRKGFWPLPNVWIGISCENQQAFDERVPKLMQVPASVRFLSCEPLLGPIDLNLWTGINAKNLNLIHWVIAGGESGHGARPMHPDWTRSLRDQCAAAGVPFFFKQWGNWNPDNFDTWRAKKCRNVDDEGTLMYWQKSKSGNFLDGKQHLEFPQSKIPTV